MKYIFVLPYRWFDDYMYKDIIDEGLVQVYYVNYPLQNPVKNFVRRIHRSYKVNRILNLPGKSIWLHDLYRMIDINTCLIFNTGALSMLDIDDLKYLKGNRCYPKMVLAIADSVDVPSGHMPIARPKVLGFSWDLILSYDPNDCRKYGFKPRGIDFYSKMTDIQPGSAKSDLYFIGRNKSGRNQYTLEIYHAMAAHHIVCNFVLRDEKKNKNKNDKASYPGINYEYHDIPYEDVISNVLSANCILEVLQKGQHAQTARYYEAVCYNKKLLTNNPNVKKLGFYDSRYMQYFENIYDIDFNWIKNRVKIDYHYNNEFSPIHLLEKIESYFDNDADGGKDCL